MKKKLFFLGFIIAALVVAQNSTAKTYTAKSLSEN